MNATKVAVVLVIGVVCAIVTAKPVEDISKETKLGISSTTKATTNGIGAELGQVISSTDSFSGASGSSSASSPPNSASGSGGASSGTSGFVNASGPGAAATSQSGTGANGGAESSAGTNGASSGGSGFANGGSSVNGTTSG